MRRRTLLIAAVVLACGALLLFCCAGRDPQVASAPPASTLATAPTTAPAPTASAHDDAPPTDTPPAPVLTSASAAPATESAPAPSTPPPVGAGASITHAVQASDPRDLQLLASIERDLKRDPPPEVHAVLAARQRGAGRDELTPMIRALPDLRLRALVLRWLNEVLPKADAGVP